MLEISNSTSMLINEEQIRSNVFEIFKKPIDSRINIVEKFESSPRLEGFAMLGRKDVYVSINGFDLKNDIQRFVFLILHEIGHSLGLQHCKNKNCIMFLKQTKNKRLYGWKMLVPNRKLENDKIFCKECRKFINQII